MKNNHSDLSSFPGVMKRSKDEKKWNVYSVVRPYGSANGSFQLLEQELSSRASTERGFEEFNTARDRLVTEERRTKREKRSHRVFFWFVLFL